MLPKIVGSTLLSNDVLLKERLKRGRGLPHFVFHNVVAFQVDSVSSATINIFPDHPLLVLKK